MIILFIILIVLASGILGLIVLVQNPKGGGLAGNIAGFSNQFMGVKQTTDVLEKGTWIFGAVIGALCMLSIFFISGRSGSNENRAKDVTFPTQNSTAPINTLPITPVQPSPNK